MIDLHCHLLPGLDDGAATVADAIALARAAEADGITQIAATPHLRSDHPGVRAADLAGRVAELERWLRAEGVGVECVVGGEVDLLWAHRASYEDLVLVSYGQRGSDILLETPYGFLPPVFEKLVNDVRALGFRVLLAHPERSQTFQADPGRLKRLVGDGVLVQVGADSLTRQGRKSRVRRFALSLIENGLAHVIASDSHGARGPRPPELSPALGAAERVAGPRASWMVTDAPAAILAGVPLLPPPRRTRRLALSRG